MRCISCQRSERMQVVAASLPASRDLSLSVSRLTRLGPLGGRAFPPQVRIQRPSHQETPESDHV